MNTNIKRDHVIIFIASHWIFVLYICPYVCIWGRWGFLFCHVIKCQLSLFCVMDSVLEQVGSFIYFHFGVAFYFISSFIFFLPRLNNLLCSLVQRMCVCVQIRCDCDYDANSPLENEHAKKNMLELCIIASYWLLLLFAMYCVALWMVYAKGVLPLREPNDLIDSVAA